MRILGFSTESRRPALLYPLTPVPRVAVFDSRFASGGNITVLGWEQRFELSRRGIETVAASPEYLRRLGDVDWRPVLPIIALTGSEGLLTGFDRQLLWRAFEVPVFQQVIDAEGRALAGECEAHEGVHIWVHAGLHLPGTTRVEALCGCGKPGSRLLPVVIAPQLEGVHDDGAMV